MTTNIAPRHGIKVTDTSAVEEFINGVNGRAKTHTASPWLAAHVAKTAEAMLDDKAVAKGKRVGAEFIYVTPPPSASSYDYRAVCSSIRYRRYAEGWRIMSAEKVERFPGASTVEDICLPEAEVERIKAAALRKALYGVRTLRRAA